jgi:hypothetical protein
MLYIVGRKRKDGTLPPKAKRECLAHPGETNRYLMPPGNDAVVIAREASRLRTSEDALFIILREPRDND